MLLYFSHEYSFLYSSCSLNLILLNNVALFIRMPNTIVCFCHWGGEHVVTVNGSVLYKRGITDLVSTRDGMTFEEFKVSVFDRLKINSVGKFLHFTVKFDPKQLILLKENIGVQMLITCNNEYAHVFVSDSELHVASSHHSDTNR